MENILSYLKPLIGGMLVGGVFSYFKLPVPAPATIHGVLGVLGLTVGYLLINRFLN